MKITINLDDELTNRDDIDYEKYTNGEELNVFKIMFEGLFVRDENGDLVMDTDPVMKDDQGEPLLDGNGNEIPNRNYGLPLRLRRPAAGKIVPLLYIYARKHDASLTYEDFLDLPRSTVREAAYQLGEYVVKQFDELQKAVDEAKKNVKGPVNG